MHVLDNPVWHALTGPHATVAERAGRAARYVPDVAVFAALPDEPTPDAWDDLRELVGAGRATAILARARSDRSRDVDRAVRARRAGRCCCPAPVADSTAAPDRRRRRSCGSARPTCRRCSRWSSARGPGRSRPDGRARHLPGRSRRRRADRDGRRANAPATGSPRSAPCAPIPAHRGRGLASTPRARRRARASASAARRRSCT